MSLTVVNMRLNVRKILGDLHEAAYAITDERLTQVMIRQARLYRALSGAIETTDPLNVTAGGTDFGLSIQVARVIAVKDSTMGVLLDRLSREEIDDLLEGVGSGIPQGRPTHYAVIETAASSVTTLRFYPQPNAAIAYDVYVESLAAYGTTDATELVGSEYTLRAIELSTAAEAAMLMPDEDRARIKLNHGVIPSWKADAERFARLERERYDRLRTAVGRIPAQVN